jgi:F0F1-type ATP synthase epsilon subunit
LGDGKLTLTTAGTAESFTIAGGYVEVRDNQVRILADKVE